MKLRKIMAILFALFLAVGVMALSASASEIVASGTCGADGDNLTWTLDDEGTLTISGEGEMEDCGTYGVGGSTWTESPWSEYDVYHVFIEEGVTSIGAFMFNECDTLNSVVISDSVIFIGGYAFRGCDNLEKVVLPNGVTDIEEETFAECTSLTSISIPDSVLSIGNRAFFGCTSLSRVTIPRNVVYIGHYAFSCSVKYIFFEGDLPRMGGGVVSYAKGEFPAGNTTWLSIMHSIVEEDDQGNEISRYYTDFYVNLNCVSMKWYEAKPLIVISEPQITYTQSGKKAQATVKAEGNDVTYQWYISANGKTFSESSITGKTYSVMMSEASKDRYVYCVVTDVFGNMVQSDTVQLHMAATITEQPEDTKVKLGGTAEVSVTAVGDGLTYAWYAAAAGSDTFTKSSTFTGNTYSVEMTENRNGRRVYCVVTDQYGNSETSNTVTLSIQEPPVITTQPKLTFTKQGATAKTTVAATGDGLTYQWYFKSAGQKSYSKSSCTSATYSTKMSSASKDRIVYCVIKDKYGNSVTSTKVYLRMAATITKQPTHASAAVGSVAKTKVTAVGDGLTYQWYLKNPGATKFSKSSVTSSTYSAKMTAANDGRQVYCVVTDKYGKTAKSNTVTLGLPVTITTQPKLTFTKQGATAKTTVKADGDGLTYQWYFKSAGQTSYSKSSCTSATYSTTMSSKSKNRIVYCVIKDQYGNSVTSTKVYLRMAATITTQPKDVMAAKGSTAKVTVKAVGDGLTYTWYFKNAGASKFSKSTTCTGTSYSAVMNAARDGRQIYCVVTDKYGKTAKSNTVTLSME